MLGNMLKDEGICTVPPLDMLASITAPDRLLPGLFSHQWTVSDVRTERF